MSFSSGIPLGLVWNAMPDWLRASGAELQLIGLLTLAQAPWSIKLLWAPLLDLGDRKRLIALTQVALAIAIGGAALAGSLGEEIWLVGSLLLAAALLIALASATHDIVVDAYAVDVLREDEQGLAVGLRTATYRIGMLLAGGVTISLAAATHWGLACGLLALLYVPLLLVTLSAPSVERIKRPTRLADALWKPLLDLLGRPVAMKLLAFVVLYKLCDNLSQSLLRPFLVDMGYDANARGLAYGTVGLVATLVGTAIGGIATDRFGVVRSLWIFGVLQIGSNLGYIGLTLIDPHLGFMLGAMAFEHLTSGLGMGAFGVFLLRATARRFSATQYALLSSLFALPRVLAGPVVAELVAGLGWRLFFWVTIAAGLPGMLALWRMAPWGSTGWQPSEDERPGRFERRIALWAVPLCALGGLAGTIALYLAGGAELWPAELAGRVGRTTTLAIVTLLSGALGGLALSRR